MGILKWVDYTVSDASYFKLNTDHTPLHLVLLDEVMTRTGHHCTWLLCINYTLVHDLFLYCVSNISR